MGEAWGRGGEGEDASREQSTTSWQSGYTYNLLTKVTQIHHNVVSQGVPEQDGNIAIIIKSHSHNQAIAKQLSYSFTLSLSLSLSLSLC